MRVGMWRGAARIGKADKEWNAEVRPDAAMFGGARQAWNGFVRTVKALPDAAWQARQGSDGWPLGGRFRLGRHGKGWVANRGWQGTARHGRRGRVRRRESGRCGNWLGLLRQREAGQTARGVADTGRSRRDKAWCGTAGMAGIDSHRPVRRAALGRAWRGRRVLAWSGQAFTGPLR
jgi:hypothetical protein